MTLLQWAPLRDEELPELVHLAQVCLAKDGGMPLLGTEKMLRRLFLSSQAIGGRDEMGDLVGAVALGRDSQGRPQATGLVHPAFRGQGVGEQLIVWVREQAAGEPLVVLAETTSPESDTLYARAGLTRVFAEHIMRHRLRRIPSTRRPAGLHTRPFDDETAPLFHEAYRQSFATRPGFIETPAAEWLDWLRAEEGFRPEQSRVVLDDDDAPAGFVIVMGDWIDQVGVVPAWRGHALGAYLVVRSLKALRDAKAKQAWLCVNVDNPALELYGRLGFKQRGTRARYADRSIADAYRVAPG